MTMFQYRQASSLLHYRLDTTVRLWIRVIVTTNIILVLFHRIVLSTSIIDTTTSNRNLYHRTSWYTKYDVYPEYCSTPEQMSKRHIPAIGSTSEHHGMIGETQLLHVTAIIRHGARTPYKANLNCWDDSMYVGDEKRWDCNLTTILSPPPPGRIHQEEGDGVQQSEREEFGSKKITTISNEMAMFLFEKKYDSLQLPLGNELNGTCQKGQLLLQGYEQEYTNGQILRSAYVHSSKSKDSSSDSRLHLFDSTTNGVDGKYLWDNLYYRADDDQRTLMSAQVVLRGLFDPELQTYVLNKEGEYPIIPLHTADRETDIVEPNTDDCPRLSEINDDIQSNDPEYDRIFVSSKEAELLFKFQNDVLKLPNPDAFMDNIDCLMTIICTDRTLPDPVNDYTGKTIAADPNQVRYLDYNNSVSSTNNQSDDGLDGTIRNYTLESDGTDKVFKDDSYDKIYGPNRFQRLVNYESSQYGYFVSYNDGEFSKLGTGPLWEEILRNIRPFLSDTTQLKRPLAIIAGHDTTIIPLLVSLGPNVWDQIWPTYASMIILELHAINIDGLSNRTIFPSNYAFRLLNNGKVITPRIEGCELELCDITVLLNIVESFMKLYITNCTRQKQPSMSFEDVIDKSEAMVSTKDGAILFVALCLLCMICGSVCTCIFMKYALSRAFGSVHQHHYQQGGPIDPDDDSYIDDFPKRTITIA